MRFSHDIENYQGLGLCYPPQPSASVDNTNLVLDNSQYHAQPHSIIVYYVICAQRIVVKSTCRHLFYYGELVATLCVTPNYNVYLNTYT